MEIRHDAVLIMRRPLMQDARLRQMCAMPDQRTRTVILILGMRDNGCRERIAAALEAIDGVKDVEVNLFHACARIIHEPPCEQSRLVRTIISLGYGAFPARLNSRNENKH